MQLHFYGQPTAFINDVSSTVRFSDWKLTDHPYDLKQYHAFTQSMNQGVSLTLKTQKHNEAADKTQVFVLTFVSADAKNVHIETKRGNKAPIKSSLPLNVEFGSVTLYQHTNPFAEGRSRQYILSAHQPAGDEPLLKLAYNCVDPQADQFFLS